MLKQLSPDAYKLTISRSCDNGWSWKIFSEQKCLNAASLANLIKRIEKEERPHKKEG